MNEAITRYTDPNFLDATVKDAYFPSEDEASRIRVRFKNDALFEMEYRIKHNPRGLKNTGQIFVRPIGLGYDADYTVFWNPVEPELFERAWLYLCDRIFDNERRSREVQQTEIKEMVLNWNPEIDPPGS